MGEKPCCINWGFDHYNSISGKAVYKAELIVDGNSISVSTGGVLIDLLNAVFDEVIHYYTNTDYQKEYNEAHK